MKPLIRKIYYLILRLSRKWWHAPLLFISLPITLILTIIFPYYKIKLMRLCSDRIGHYAMNTELLLCYLDEIKIKEKRTKYFFYTLDAPVCNNQLHIMWKRIIPIIPFPKVVAQINACLYRIFGNQYKDSVLRKFETGSGNEDINGYLKKYAPHLSFTSTELLYGKKILSELGIPDGMHFVCLVVRDPTYLNKYLPGNDWSYHFYRNSNIENFTRAALFLANKGYYVIRMGKKVEKSFDLNHTKIIDYASLPLRSDFADIYLASHCEFFTSTPTGLDAIPEIFRKPVLFVNVAPLASELQYWYPSEFFILKKIYDKKKEKFISLKDLDETINGSCEIKKIFDSLGWSVVENTEDEILEAVCEMERFVSLKSNEKTSNLFHKLLKTSLPYSVFSNRDVLRLNPEKFYIRMCSQFMKENYSLISEGEIFV